jgi:methylenetetrahydrofolate reductase (NADPH)
LTTIETALNIRDFGVTSELNPGPRPGGGDIRRQADLLWEHVDAVPVTGNQSGRPHLSSLAASVLLLQADIEPITQLRCRNRYRVALLADRLGTVATPVASQPDWPAKKLVQKVDAGARFLRTNTCMDTETDAACR